MLICACTSMVSLRWNNEMKGTVLLSSPWANRSASWYLSVSGNKQEARWNRKQGSMFLVQTQWTSLNIDAEEQKWPEDKMGRDDCKDSYVCANSLTPFPCCYKANSALHTWPTQGDKCGDKATSTLAPSCRPSGSLCSTHQLIINHPWR